MRQSGQRRRLSRRLLLSLLSAVLWGCPSKDEVIIKTAAGVELTAADIDKDPLALLPPAAVALMNVDAPALFQSAFGQRLLQILQSRLPVPPEAGFEPARDLRRLYVGLYSMQGVDFAGVAVGNFNPSAIANAAEATLATPLGMPLRATQYAERTLYVSNNVGFVVLTPATVLFGNETGIRRALDRIQRGRVEHEVPGWMDDLMKTPDAAIAGGFDLASEPAIAAAAASFPFLHQVQTARILGNFQPPGMNFAGTMTYPSSDAAGRGAAEMLRTRDTLQTLSFFTQLAGMGQPIQRLDARPSGSEVQFVLALDGNAVGQLIEQLAGILGVPPAPVEATTSAPVQTN